MTRATHQSKPGDILEGRVDEFLERLLEVPDAHVKLHVIDTELRVPVVQQVVALGLEILHSFKEHVR